MDKSLEKPSPPPFTLTPHHICRPLSCPLYTQRTNTRCTLLQIKRFYFSLLNLPSNGWLAWLAAATRAIKQLSGACSSNMHANLRRGKHAFVTTAPTITNDYYVACRVSGERCLIHLLLWPERQSFTCTREPPDGSINSVMKGHNLLLFCLLAATFTACFAFSPLG